MTMIPPSTPTDYAEPGPHSPVPFFAPVLDDHVGYPLGPIAPTEPLTASETRGRNVDKLEIVTTISNGNAMVNQTEVVMVLAGGVNTMPDPYVLQRRSGFIIRRRIWIPGIVYQWGMFLSTEQTPGPGNSVALFPGDPPVEFVGDSDLYVSWSAFQTFFGIALPANGQVYSICVQSFQFEPRD